MKRLINRVSFFISSVLFVIIVLFTNIVYAEKNEKEKLEVLFISSYSLNFISFEDQVQGIREGLNNNANIKIEYMNSSNIDLEENELRFYDLVKMNLENYNNYFSRYDALYTELYASNPNGFDFENNKYEISYQLFNKYDDLLFTDSVVIE